MSLVINSLTAEDASEHDPVLQSYVDSYCAAESADSIAYYLSGIVTYTSRTNLEVCDFFLEEFKSLKAVYKEPIIAIEYYNAKGISYYAQEMPIDSILHYYDLAEEKLDQNQLKQTALRISIKNNRANAYSVALAKESAIYEYLAGLAIIESSEQDMPRYATALYSNIADLLNSSERYKDALDYILKGEETNRQHELSIGERSYFYEWILLNKAKALSGLNKSEEAEIILEELEQLFTQPSLESVAAKALRGTVHYQNGNKELAKETIREAIKISKSLNIGARSEIYARHQMAKLEMKEGNSTSALKNLNIIFELKEQQGKNLDDPSIYLLTSQALEDSDRNKEAIFYLKLYQSSKHQTSEEDLRMHHGELKGNFSYLEKKYKDKSIEINQALEKTKLYTLIFAVLFSLAIMVLIFMLYKRKENHNNHLIKANENIRAVNEKAKIASKAKEDFLSRMSHEMRTPMNAVIGILNILLDENPSKSQQKHLENQLFSAEMLLNIINDVLEFSKISTKKVKVQFKPVKLQDYLNSTIASFNHANTNPDIKILQEQNLGKLDKLVYSDSSLFSQTLTNLVGNAIKFTNKGYVILRSDIVKNNSDQVGIKFAIEDTGIGIPEHKLQSIFDSFSQVNNESNRRHEGVGLGLTITKELLNLAEIDLNVKSTEGVGSTFSFTIVFNKVKNEVKQMPITKREGQIYKRGIEGKKILLVEDNKLNQLVAKKVLHKFKTVVTLAENGQEAVDKVQKDQFDIILMDIHMPLMDGLEATEAIRALHDPIYQQIPIIALTADAYSKRVQDTIHAGMNDFLSKPYQPEDLFQKIKENLNEEIYSREALG